MISHMIQGVPCIAFYKQVPFRKACDRGRHDNNLLKSKFEKASTSNDKKSIRIQQQKILNNKKHDSNSRISLTDLCHNFFINHLEGKILEHRKMFTYMVFLNKDSTTQRVFQDFSSLGEKMKAIDQEIKIHLDKWQQIKDYQFFREAFIRGFGQGRRLAYFKYALSEPTHDGHIVTSMVSKLASLQNQKHQIKTALAPTRYGMLACMAFKMAISKSS